MIPKRRVYTVKQQQQQNTRNPCLQLIQRCRILNPRSQPLCLRLYQFSFQEIKENLGGSNSFIILQGIKRPKTIFVQPLCLCLDVPAVTLMSVPREREKKVKREQEKKKELLKNKVHHVVSLQPLIHASFEDCQGKFSSSNSQMLSTRTTVLCTREEGRKRKKRTGELEIFS